CRLLITVAVPASPCPTASQTGSALTQAKNAVTRASAITAGGTSPRRGGPPGPRVGGPPPPGGSRAPPRRRRGRGRAARRRGGVAGGGGGAPGPPRRGGVGQQRVWRGGAVRRHRGDHHRDRGHGWIRLGQDGRRFLPLRVDGGVERRLLGGLVGVRLRLGRG